ncbi:unnamed protein product [Chrysoparadoxa australica]
MSAEAAREGGSAADAKQAVSQAYHKVAEAVQRCSNEAGLKPPRLVVVTKTKPVDLLQVVYDEGVRDMGENYVAELLEKAQVMPGDIRWRYIGTLQSNKCKGLIEGVPSLQCVETIGTAKLASKLNVRNAPSRHYRNILCP